MDAASASAPQQPAREHKRHNGTPVLAVSSVLVLSALGWQLMGAGVVVHFLVLLSGIAIGALFRQSAFDRRHGASDRATAPVAATAAAAAAAAAGDSGASAGEGTPVSSNGGGPASPPSGQQESLIPSLLLNTTTATGGGGVSSAAGATASFPLHWVGETMEGSINWLCGNGNGRKTATAAEAAEQSNGGRSSVGGRRRSRSTGGASPTTSRAAAAVAPATARSAATSPARDGALRRAETDTLLPARRGGAGGAIPQEQQQEQAPPPPRSRLWSRTFGVAAAGSGMQQQQPTAEGFATDAYDGDDSVEDNETDGDESSLRSRGAAAGVGDWLVGAGLGDTRYYLLQYAGSTSCSCRHGNNVGHIFCISLLKLLARTFV